MIKDEIKIQTEHKGQFKVLTEDTYQVVIDDMGRKKALIVHPVHLQKV